jgi:Fic-DOC domain mobile mystery protein B
MFGGVWAWAGRYRTTDKNIGVEHAYITEEVAKVIADARFWVEDEAFSAAETAVRFHHRLVWIHPFPNGNGRHSRLMADLLVMHLGRERFTWGSANLQNAGGVRTRYIEALKTADNHDIAPLLAFVRS